MSMSGEEFTQLWLCFVTHSLFSLIKISHLKQQWDGDFVEAVSEQFKVSFFLDASCDSYVSLQPSG